MGHEVKYEVASIEEGFENWTRCINVFSTALEAIDFLYDMHRAELNGEYKFRNIRIE